MHAEKSKPQLINPMIYTHAVEEDDGIGVPQELQLMGDDNPRRAGEVSAYALVKEVSGDPWIDGAQRVVQEVEIGRSIHGTGQVNASALTTRKERSALAYERQVAVC